MPPETQRQIAGSLNLAFSEVDFDSVKRVIRPAKIETPEDVEAWCIVAAQRLPK